MEKSAADRDSRVGENSKSPGKIPSNAVHVKLCMNPSRPRDKAKYYLATDSEPVPGGKGEKNPCEGSETEPETSCIQCVGAAARR